MVSMPVDVTTETVISRPIADVWAYAADPTTAPQWYANIDRVEPLTPGPVEVGSRMLFSARFLGRTLSYTYEVRELEPSTRLTGEPSGFGAIAAPAMAMAMRRANRADLARIRAILEGVSS